MRIKDFFVLLVLFTSPASATVVSVGSLDFENTGNTIVSDDGYTYSSFNNTGLGYAALLSEITNSSSAWYGYSVASSDDADRFANSLLGGASSCGQLDPYGKICGIALGHRDNLFGNSYTIYYDYVTFVSTQNTPGRIGEIGLMGVDQFGRVRMWDDWSSIQHADTYVQRSGHTVNYLMVKATGPTPVPEPSAIALMGLGLLGFGVTHRKQKKN